VLIAAVFVTGGIVLLGVQYLLVQGLFDTAIGSIAGCADSGDAPPADPRCVEISGDTGQSRITIGTDGTSVLVQQTTVLSQEVLSGLLLWSIVTLAAFTLVAVAAASWLSRRSFARIRHITDTTRRITRNGLHQRLELPGPADEIKELGDTIDAMLDGLEASFAQQERFIANASHELRTPLTTTRTALEIPLEQGRVPAELEPALHRALDANRRSEQLIAALLRLARVTAAPATAEGPVDLRGVVEGSLSDHAQEIAIMHLVVRTDLAAATTVGVDPTLLELAVDNVIQNAIRHNHAHGTIHLVTGTTDDRPWIEITNSGPVVAREETAGLTEPFNRGRSTRTTARGRGLGLGLTLVKNIADTLGATLSLTPAAGGGLTVRLQL